jgi:hypothetical protein
LQSDLAQLMEARLANAELRAHFEQARLAIQGVEDRFETLLGFLRARELVDKFESSRPTSTHDHVLHEARALLGAVPEERSAKI